MAELAPQFAEAFRDYTINDEPASGVYQPEKQKIRALGGLIDDALNEKVSADGAQTLTEKTLKAPVIEGYTEGHAAASGAAFAPVLGDDTIFAFSTTGNAIITLPAAVVGKSFTIAVIYGGAHSITWAGAARRWPKGEVPTPTSVAGKIDVFTFLCVVAGTWLAFPSGENF